MKFAQAYLGRQAPLWADAYLDYARCKALIKDGKLAELDAAVERHSRVVSQFLQREATVIERCEEKLAACCGDLAGPAAIRQPAKVSTEEYKEAQYSVQATADHAARLHGYVGITQKAVQRLACKRLLSVPDKGTCLPLEGLNQVLEQYRTTFDAALARLNSALQYLRRHLTVALDTSDQTSQLIRQIARREKLPEAQEAEQALFNDDANALMHWVQSWVQSRRLEPPDQVLITVMRAIVYGALIHKAHNVLDAFVPKLRSQREDDWSDYLHLCVKLAGRRFEARQDEKDSDLGYAGRLWDVLDNLHPQELHSALHRRDATGCLPLHYAAQYDMPGVCKELMARMGSSDALLPGHQAFETSPLHVAINLGHEKATEVLLNSFKMEECNSSHAVFRQGLLTLAIRSRYPKITTVILAIYGKDPLPESVGSKALMLAARVGNLDAVQQLLGFGVSTDARDAETGETALAFSAAQDNLEMLRLLLHAGCDTELRDLRGWTAIEHASYRGHRKVVELLEQHVVKQNSSRHPAGGCTTKAKSIPATKSTSLGSQLLRKNQHKSHILVSLGTLDLERPVPTLDIAPYQRKVAPLLVPESSLVLKVSALGCDEQGFSVDFPILEDLVNNPWCYSSAKVDDVQLVLELYTTAMAHGQNTCIGTAVALLSSLHQDLEGGRDSLVRAQTLPLINPQVGLSSTLTISLLIVRPYKGHTRPYITTQSLQSPDRTIVGGHRGLGQNDNRQKHLQLGENTLDSCKKAIEMGTRVLEFDVQVTKDLKPIIYHDFLVGETGTDIPIHELTFSQFMILSDIQSMSIEARFLKEKHVAAHEEDPGTRARANSAGASQMNVPMLLDRMKATMKYSNTSFKPNIRGQCIHSPFATLADLLTKLDESVTFDVEIKFPMLYEARLWKMDTFHVDLNLFIDTILEVIYKHAGSRPIFFSSFSPDACIMLALKQTTYPIVFLSDGGKYEAFDERATSLQTAVHFARTWGLRGVVLASEPLVATPRLVQVVKDQGLYMASYGAQNDEVEFAKLQADAGLDLIIVNQVRKISMALGDYHECT